MKFFTLIASSVLVLGLAACSEDEVIVAKDYTRTVKVHTVVNGSGSDEREFSSLETGSDEGLQTNIEGTSILAG